MNQKCECIQPPIPGLLDSQTVEIPHPPTREEELEASAIHWEGLAVEAERASEMGITHPTVAQCQAGLYRRTAKALRIQAETGVAVCVCCLKPFSRGNGISHN